MTKAEYADYLKTEHWQTTRAAALKRADHRCQVCNGDKYLQVHHRTYERVGSELPADLTVLCRGCHKLFHSVSSLDSKRRAKRRSPARATPKRSKKNWSAMTVGQQEALRHEVVIALADGKPLAAYEIGQQLGAKTGAIGTCCATLRRMGLVYKKNNRWAATKKAAVWLGTDDRLAARDTALEMDAELDALLERAA